MAELNKLEHKKSIKKPLLLLTVSLLLLFLVLRKVGFRELSATIAQANGWWVFISICLDPLLVFVSVLRWQALIKSQGYRVSLGRLNALYLVGKFFNNFLPSNVGGDVIRGYELNRDTKDLGAAMASVFIDRFIGFVVLVVMALVSFFAAQQFFTDIRFSLVMLFSISGLVGVVWVILDTRLITAAGRWKDLPVLRNYIPKLQKFHANLRAFKNERGALVWAFLWSAVFMVLAIFNVYASARAFHHQPVSFIEIAVVVPVIMVVAMLPLSLNGIGLEEWAYVLLFSWLGLSASVGLSTVFLIRAKSLLLALLGGLLYPVIKLRSSPATSDSHGT